MRNSKIVISGSTGLIGSALVRALKDSGHQVLRLVRTPNRQALNSTVDATGDEILWNPAEGVLSPSTFEGVDAVIHLSGENIAQGRWTASRKAAIFYSRVQTTELVAAGLAAVRCPPRVWLCASAVGYYGNRGDERLTEDSSAGAGFLADVCKKWEAATEPAARMGVRVVNLRFGPVLSAQGGALARMLTPFKFGLGGVLGDGRQYMSWVTLDDVVAAVRHILDTDSISGPVNVVAPNPVTNHVFTKALGAVLRRPTVLAAPGVALRLAFGQMADEVLLAGARVVPERLARSGFAFADPELEPALRRLLRR